MVFLIAAIFVLALLLNLAGIVLLCVNAAKHNALWILAIVCVPCGAFFFAVRYWPETKTAVHLVVSAIALNLVASALVMSSPDARRRGESIVAAAAPGDASGSAPTSSPDVEPSALPSQTVGGRAGSTGQHEGSLILVANVPGARLSVDGRDVGAAPVTLDAVQPGPHVVECLLPTFETYREEFTLEPSEVRTVSVRLDPVGPPPPGSFGFVTIEDATPGRSAQMLGATIGTTPLAATPVPVGFHEVRITAPDGSSVTTRALVEQGVTSRVVAPASAH